MEKKKKGVQCFFKLSAGRHKREATSNTLTQAVKGRKGGEKWVKPLIILLTIGVVAAVAITFRDMKAKATITQARSHNTALAERRDISPEPSSSGTLRARDTYSITPMVEDEMLSAGFEEGDQMEKDQVLYEIDKSSMGSQLTSSVNSLSRSQSSYEGILEDYNDALGDCNGSTHKATDTGYIRELHISVGGKVNGNTKLTDVYGDDVMKIEIPFLSGKVAMIGAGIPTAVTLTDTGEQMAGTVKAVADQETVLTDGRPMRAVAIQMQNSGGLTTSLRAMAQVGEFTGSKDGAFEALVGTTMNADLSIGVEVESLLVNVGDYITKGAPVFKMTDKSTDKLIQNYKDTLDKVEESMKSARSKLGSTQDGYDNYAIKAPTSDQIIIKDFKVGDNIAKDSSSTTVLATIYDLSGLAFRMSIDELDTRKVKIGQRVGASVDAFGGQTFSGTVASVSLESTYSSGVSTYPVTVTLDDMGDLLPGMNVDGVITLEGANDVLVILVGILMRGNQVHVEDDIVTEQQRPVLAGFRSMKVKTGLVSDTYVEITGGLPERDVVYVVESSKDNSSFMMMMDGGMGGPPGKGGNMGGQNRDGSGGRRNR